MKTRDEPSFVDGAPVHDQLVEMVKEFPYLGSTICNDSEVDNDVKIKTAKPANAFGYLKKPIFTSHHVSVNVKRAVYKAVVLATLLQLRVLGSESYPVKSLGSFSPLLCEMHLGNFPALTVDWAHN